MSMNPSVWTVEGRQARIGKKITPERLEKLHKKRKRQTENLIQAHDGDQNMMKKVNRWKDKLCQ